MTAAVAPPSTTTALALGAAGLSGILVALQQRVNGALRVDLGDAVLAALVSFATGLVVVAVVVASRRSSRRALPLLRSTPWWSRLGGLGGATLVVAGAAAAPVIGVALLTVGLVAGQTVGGVLVDRFGLGPGGRHGLTLPRAAGELLCFAAVGISVSGRGARAADPLLLVLVVVAGFFISLQQALNGRVRRTTGDAGVATLVNFVGGTAVLLVLLGGRDLLHPLQIDHWPGWSQWYLYAGGPIGASFVAVAATVVRLLGVLRLGLAVVAGQLVGAVLLDVALPGGAGLGLATAVGAALTLVAVGVSSLPARSAARRVATGVPG